MAYHISSTRGTIDSNQSIVAYASNRKPIHKSQIRNNYTWSHIVDSHNIHITLPKPIIEIT